MARTSLLLLAAAMALTACTTSVTQAADTLCSIPPSSYTDAKNDYPELKSALKKVEENSIAMWYSDRTTTRDAVSALNTLLDACSKSTRLSIVVYGLPNKDCSAGYSSGGGSVETSEDYVDFVTQLAQAVGDRKVLYVLEPDAVGLISDGGCAVESGYKANLLLAIPILAANANAEIYLDVGFWALTKPDTTKSVAQVVKELGKAGRLKGITLNTSNYQSTAEIAKLCTTFQTAVGSTDMHCIIDTSRNYEVAGANSTEWCNRKSAGIGKLPTQDTGFENLDYFVWIKTPGDSDGTCDGGDHSADAMEGPEAGKFFKNHFIKLWNQGYFVQEKKLSTLDDPTGAGGKSGALSLNGQKQSLLSAALVVAVAAFSYL